MADSRTREVRSRCPQCGAKLLKDPGCTGQGPRSLLKDQDYYRCPRCQPALPGAEAAPTVEIWERQR